MTGSQVWVRISVFASAMSGTFSVITTSFTRTLPAEIGGLRSEMRGEIGGLRLSMEARFRAVDARFDATNAKIESLDRDVQLLMNREFDVLATNLRIIRLSAWPAPRSCASRIRTTQG